MNWLREMPFQHRLGIVLAAAMVPSLLPYSTRQGLAPTTLVPDSVDRQPLRQGLASQASGRPPTFQRPSARQAPDVIVPSSAIALSAEACENESLRAADQLAAHYPNTAETFHVLALLSAQLRRTSDAEAYWRRAASIATDNVSYLVNIAVLAIDRGDFDTAIRTLAPVFVLPTATFDVRYNYGLALLRDGDSSAAEEVFLETVALFPNSGPSWAGLGEAQLEAGQSARALASFENARQLGMQSAELFFQLATAARLEGNVDLAEEATSAFNSLKSDNQLAPDSRFHVLSTAEARATLITTLVESAAVYAHMGDPVRAEVLLLRAIAIDPSQVEVTSALADFYQSIGHLANELVMRHHLAKLDPMRVENHLRLANTLASIGDTADAEAILKIALSHQPDSALLNAALAEFLAEAGQPAKAVVYGEEATRLSPSAPGHEFVAQMYRLLGNETAANAAVAASAAATGRDSETP